MRNNFFTYQKNDKLTVKGDFKIYQARNGSIQMVMGNRHTELSHQQINDLLIDVYELEDFNLSDFKRAYHLK